MRKVILISLAVLSICCIVAGIIYVFPALPPPDGIWEPKWSPQGNLIAFRCVFVPFDGLSSMTIFDDATNFYFWIWSDICIADQNGKQFQRLTTGGNFSAPSWSPDGKLLAWAHEGNTAWESISIWSSQEQTAETFFLTEKIDWLDDLTWSKDGRQLYLDATGAIFDIASEKLSLLPEQKVEGEELFGFVRSFDGEYLALDRYLDFLYGHPDLIITNGNQPVFVGSEFSRGNSYAWSPRENILAWTGDVIPKSEQNPEKDYDTVLFLTHAPTGQTIKYETDYSSLDCCIDVAWSPDGMSLALLAPYYLEILEFLKTDSGFPLSIANHSRLNLNDFYDGLSWSPDRKHLLVESNYDNYQIWILNIQDNKEQLYSIDFPWISLSDQ
jgi:Tol biopolymer transport system component